MGHQKLREDKTCLNCNYVVENKYCPNCGQENTETRQSFHYLFTHFVEDLTHYDGSFWRTIKSLLFRPGRLTKEYLEGRRKKFVPPVKLYIFISFVTFLLPTLLPDVSFFGSSKEKKELVQTEKDTITKKSKGLEVKDNVFVNNIKQLDSIENAATEKMSYVEYSMYKNLLKIKQEKQQKEFLKKALDFFVHALPKVLFLYMPIFAFFLWLLHDKNKRYYFDSGVFTLHYFSFLLLVITIGILLEWILHLFLLDDLAGIYNFVSLGYCFFYFFRAHSRFYGEEKIISRIKSLILFIINMFLISIFIIVLFFYSLWHIE